MKKYLFLCITCLICAHSVFSQVPAIRHPVVQPKEADSLDLALNAQKHGFRAGAMIFGLNMGVWAFDRYVRKADFSYINGTTIKNNFKEGFVWDNDAMPTNMFMHPFHGSLYFNSARSNGYSYWKSGLFALSGSLMWEMFMENEFPSTNDIIATPIGGMALGEVTFRMSDLIFDNRKTGGSRFGLEVAGFLVSPMRGITRLITGEAWRKRPTSGRHFGTPDISIDYSVGLRDLELQIPKIDNGLGIATDLDIEYGNRFDVDGAKPFDYFSINANINFFVSQPVLGQFNIIGRLVAKELVDNKKHYLSLGLYQHFDYYDSDTISIASAQTPYKFGTPASLGAGLLYKRKGVRKWDMDAYVHLNAIILGGTLSDYYKVDERTYNLASGYSAKLGVNYVYKQDKLALSFAYDMFQMFTWKGYPADVNWSEVNPKTFNAQGDRSKAILHVPSFLMDVKMYRNLYCTLALMNYTRKTAYKYYDNVYSTTSEGRLMMTYKF